ncbi:hypothetical protein D3C76_490590 [compost metagenome]
MHRGLVQRGAKSAELADLDVRPAEQLLGIAAGVLPDILAHQILPRADIQFRQRATNPQALGTGQHCIAIAEEQLAAAVGKIVGRSGKREVRQFTVVHPIASLFALQGHAKGGVASGIRRQAKWRRQVDGDTPETGIDHQLAVGAVEGQLQLIRDHATDRQRLGHAQPLRELLDLDLSGSGDPGVELTFATLGENLRSYRFIEGAGADVLSTQAFAAVETEVTFELSQLKGGIRQFQARLGRLEVDQDLRLFAPGQRNIQLQLALQVALTFPASESLGSAYWRFLENFQAIAQSACERAIKKQMAVLPGRRVGDTDVDVAHLGVEQLPLAGQNPHATVFDEHITRDLADMRPARLKRQFGIVDLEKQADAAGRFLRTMVQRALILEETLVHRTFENRGTQPFVQRRTEDGRQVLGGVATVALDHTDPQVHVVFPGAIEKQADQEVAGNLALLAQHFQVGRNQGETFLVELPGQGRVGLDVLPWLGENRVQVQHEILAVHAQLAMAKVATDAARDIACRRRAVIRVKTDVIKVGREAEPAVVGGIGFHIDQDVAQSTGDVEPLDHRGNAFRQWRQGVEQRSEGRQV